MATDISLFLLLFAAVSLAIYIWIVVPATTAIECNRSATLWVLISMLLSPVVAMLLLLALGELPVKTASETSSSQPVQPSLNS